jgi:hypothetical protein
MAQCIDCGTSLFLNMQKRCIDCKKIQRRKATQRNKEKHQYHKRPKNVYNRYQRGATRRNFVFELSFEEFNELINKSCHYCGDTPKQIGIDRVDNTLGYTSNNVVSCCTECNFMKHTMNYQTFINKCIKISKCFTTETMRLWY